MIILGQSLLAACLILNIAFLAGGTIYRWSYSRGRDKYHLTAVSAVDLIIPTREAPPGELARLLTEIRRQTIGRSSRIIVVDESSPKGRAVARQAAVEACADFIEKERYGLGPGIATSLRLGLDHASAKLVGIITDDVYFNDLHALEILTQAANEHLVMSSCIVDSCGSRSHWFHMFRRVRQFWLKPAAASVGLAHPSGACWVARTDTARAIVGGDHFSEDVESVRTLLNAGGSVRLAPWPLVSQRECGNMRAYLRQQVRWRAGNIASIVKGPRHIQGPQYSLRRRLYGLVCCYGWSLAWLLPASGLAFSRDLTALWLYIACVTAMTMPAIRRPMECVHSIICYIVAPFLQVVTTLAAVGQLLRHRAFFFDKPQWYGNAEP